MRKLSMKHVAVCAAIAFALQLMGQLIVFYLFWLSGTSWADAPRPGMVFMSTVAIGLAGYAGALVCQE